MIEIRVRWPLGLHENDRGEPTEGSVWWPDSPQVRHDLEIIVEEGCAACGPGTHWLEEREA